MNRAGGPIIASMPIANIRHRKIFHQTRKLRNETIGQWYNRLLLVANTCNFQLAFDYFLLEQFICGLEDEYVDRLCHEMDSITLEQTIQILVKHEQTRGVIDPIAEIKMETFQPHSLLEIEDRKDTARNEIDCDPIDAYARKDMPKVFKSKGRLNFNPKGEISKSDGDRESNLIDDYNSDNSDSNEIGSDYHPTNEDSGSDSDSKPAHTEMKDEEIVTKATDSNTEKKSTKRRKRSLNSSKKLHCKTQEKFDMAPAELEMSSDFKPFSCKICGQSFKYKSNVSRCFNRHKMVGEKNCLYCGVQFLYKGYARNHVDIESAVKTYQCDRCVKKRRGPSKYTIESGKLHYKTRQMLDTAPPEMEISADFKTFTCRLCGHSTKDKKCLIYHIKSHQNIRDVMCEICGAAFRHRGSYNKHLKGHKGIREHKCDECAKSFRTKTELKTHKRTHTNIKEFICQVCNKAFRMKSHLGYHMRTHTGEKPYTCQFCNKSFSQSSSMKTHIKGHQ